MPLKSSAQQHYLFANKPDVAKEFAKKTPEKAYKKLPQHVDDNVISKKELPAWKRRKKKIQ